MVFYSDMSDEDYDGFQDYDDYFMNYYDEFEDDYDGSATYSDDTEDDMDSPIYPEKYCKFKNRNQNCVTIMEGLNEDRRAGEMCDGTIKVDGLEFPVHRVVLKVASPYFRAMFSGSFDEREKKCIEIQDVSKAAFEVILNFIYGEPGELTEANLLEVYNCSDMLCVDSVLKECKDYLRCNCLQMNDKIAAYLLAKRMELIDATESIIEYFCRELSSVIQQPYFLEIPYEVLLEVLEKKVLSSHVIETMVEAIILWVTHDPDSRFSKVDTLISHVHLDQVPNITIEKLVTALGAVHLVDEAMAKNRDTLLEKIQSNSTLIRRMLCNFRLNLLCFSNSRTEAAMSEFHYSTLAWKNHDPSIGISEEGQGYFVQVDNKPEPKFTTEIIQTVLLLKNEVYVFGTQTVLAYNLLSESTRALASLPNTRVNFCVVASESTMIVVGGDRQEVLRYDFLSNTWIKLCMWYHPRCKVGAELYNGVIYMMGGHSGKKSKSCNYFLSYNISSRRFIRLTKFERYVNSPRTAAFNNQLFVFGEQIPLDFLSAIFRPKETCLCQIYDIAKKTWSDSNAKILSSETILDVTSVADGILVVVMNKEGTGTKITLSLYKPDCDTLDYVACLPLPREPRFLMSKHYLVEAR